MAEGDIREALVKVLEADNPGALHPDNRSETISKVAKRCDQTEAAVSQYIRNALYSDDWFSDIYLASVVSSDSFDEFYEYLSSESLTERVKDAFDLFYKSDDLCMSDSKRDDTLSHISKLTDRSVDEVSSIVAVIIKRIEGE